MLRNRSVVASLAILALLLLVAPSHAVEQAEPLMELFDAEDLPDIEGAEAAPESDRRSLRRKRKKRYVYKEQMPEYCEALRGAERKDTFSACMDGQRNDTPNYLNGTCDVHNNPNIEYDERRASCQQDEACQFYGPPGSPKEIHSCVNNPCFRINNGRCTVQHTGGRCVWWSREDNKRFRGLDFPGCYTSPCHHPINNTPKGCLEQNKLVPLAFQGLQNANDFKEDSPFQCTYCLKGPGCVNAQLTTKAQCWNLGKAPGCSNCRTPRFDGKCPSSKCYEECCGNDSYCKCVPRSKHAIDVIV